jgi:hypothetical protein
LSFLVDTAGLLMPDPMFSRALRGLGDGLQAVEGLAEQCCTSLTATSIRYAQKTTVPVAVVMSTGPRVDFCFISKALQDFEDLTWLRKGQCLPGGVATDRFNQDPTNIREARKIAAETDLRDWFGGPRSIPGTEEIIGLGGYGRTLTILSSEVFADEEEEDLEESWTPRFRRR